MCGCGTPVSYTGSDEQFWQQMAFLYDLHHHHCSCTLLMGFSLGWINASDNELTFSIIIVLDINTQTPCKNNHCMLKLCRLKKKPGVHYLNISRNGKGYFQLKSKHHCTTNINPVLGQKELLWLQSSELLWLNILARHDIFPKTCRFVLKCEQKKEAAFISYSLLPDHLEGLCYIKSANMT